jgi:hypothetical protein
MLWFNNGQRADACARSTIAGTLFTADTFTARGDGLNGGAAALAFSLTRKRSVRALEAAAVAIRPPTELEPLSSSEGMALFLNSEMALAPFPDLDPALVTRSIGLLHVQSAVLGLIGGGQLEGAEVKLTDNAALLLERDVTLHAADLTVASGSEVRDPPPWEEPWGGEGARRVRRGGLGFSGFEVAFRGEVGARGAGRPCGPHHLVG